MSQEQNKKTLRHFQCRDYLWEIFEQMSGELECSTDYLINEAMRQYARSRNYGSRTPAAAGSSRPSEPSAAPAPAVPAPMPMAAPTAPIPRMDAPPAIPAMPRPQAPSAPPRPSIPSAPPPPPARPAAPPAYPGAYAAPAVPSYPSAPGYPSAPPALPTAPRPSYPSQGGYGAPPATPSYAPETQRPPSFGSAPPPLPAAPRVPSSPGVAPAPVGGAMPTLFAIFNGQKVPVAKEEFVIGRGSKSADLAIKDGNISRRHAAVVFQAGAFYMKDLGSTNGVEHQGRRIDSKRIEEGDLFQICDYEIRFTYR